MFASNDWVAELVRRHPDYFVGFGSVDPHVYMDLSGWRPKYFSANLVQYCSTIISHKALYGSDFPGILPDRWMSDFAAMPFRDEARPKIMLENAKRLLKLDV